MNSGSINKKNSGHEFEDDIAATCARYRAHRVMKVEKVSQPVRVFGFGKFQRVIMLANPFLDFIGVWTALGNRSLTFEAKSTQKDRLPVGGAAGLTRSQVDAGQFWQASGAVTFLLWEHAGEVVLVDWSRITEILKTRRHLKRTDGLRVPFSEPTGHDFESLAATLYRT